MLGVDSSEFFQASLEATTFRLECGDRVAVRVARVTEVLYSADVGESLAQSLSGYVARTSPFSSARFGFFIPNQWWDMGDPTLVMHCSARDGDSQRCHTALDTSPRSEAAHLVSAWVVA